MRRAAPGRGGTERGVSGDAGSGVLYYQGGRYPFSVGGLGVGGIGISKIEAFAEALHSVGLDWLGDAEVFQLVCLGPDLYNGICGIGVFLAAHAAVTGNKASAELAYAGLAQLRKNLKGRNAARLARALGLGGAVGLGSIVYALAVMAKSLQDDGLLADARQAAELFTDDLIAADKQLDVVSGSAGGILALLRLYRDSRSDDVLRLAVKCGEHLLGQPRLGPQGRR